MAAVGYTSGDPRKVDVAGDTMTGPLILSETPDPADPVLQAATKQYVDDSGGGGGGGTPSNTVVTETSYGQSATAGSASAYSRGDHSHGTPAAVSVPSAGASVVTETSFGQSATAGAAGTWSRSDHSHGTPAAPSIPSAGSSVVTETSFGQASSAGAATAYSRADHTHGTPAAPSVPSASGTVASETSFGISPSAGVAATFSRGDHTHGTPASPGGGGALVHDDPGFVSAGSNGTDGYTSSAGGTNMSSTRVVAAVVGDTLEMVVTGLKNNGGNSIRVDAATIVSAARNRYFSSGTSTPRPGGYGGGYLDSGRFIEVNTILYHTVNVDDISGGNVTVQAVLFSDSGDDVLRMNDVFVGRIVLKNLGQSS